MDWNNRSDLEALLKRKVSDLEWDKWVADGEWQVRAGKHMNAALEAYDASLAATSTAARKTAMARVEKDPRNVAKQRVRELWLLWTEDASRYASHADFARFMLEKFDDVLRSTRVIEGWSTEWSKAAGLHFDRKAQLWVEC